MIPRPADTRGAFFVLKRAEVGHCIEGFVVLMHASNKLFVAEAHSKVASCS